jgi:hypothetical protein
MSVNAIYKAAGFLPSPGANGGRRALVRLRGVYLSERSARARFGTSSARKLAKLGLRVETVLSAGGCGGLMGQGGGG